MPYLCRRFTSNARSDNEKSAHPVRQWYLLQSLQQQVNLRPQLRRHGTPA